jgi:hypothetical protein
VERKQSGAQSTGSELPATAGRKLIRVGVWGGFFVKVFRDRKRVETRVWEVRVRGEVKLLGGPRDPGSQRT